MILYKSLTAFNEYTSNNILTIFNHCSIHHRIIFSFKYSKTLNKLSTNIDVENFFLIDFSNIWQKIYVKFQELLTIRKHLKSHPVFSGVRVTWSSVFCVLFCRSLFVLMSCFFMAIVLSVLLPFSTPVYPFGIFKLFFLFHQYLSYILAVIFIIGRNHSTLRKQLTCRKSMINLTT